MKVMIWKDKNLLHWQKKFLHKYTNDKNYRKVKDDYHYTGKYRGAAYSIDNLKFSILKSFLWFFTMDQARIIILS